MSITSTPGGAEDNRLAEVADLGLARAAYPWLDAEFSVVPVGTGRWAKQPPLKWGKYTTERATHETLRAWLNDPNCHGIGIVFGAVSGNAEGLEIEGRAAHLAPDLISAIRETADLRGLDGPALITKLMTYVEVSPTTGFHWVYRVDGVVPGNTELAYRPDPDAEGGRKVIIETRGEGGFFVAAPTPAKCHNLAEIRAAGVGWEIAQGQPGVVATLTADEHALVHEVARTFDEMPAEEEPPRVDRGPAPAWGGELRPGDDYNARADWATDLLEPAGWRLAYTRADGAQQWVRPGKNPRDGASATVGHCGDKFYNFSSNAGLPVGKAMDKFGLYAHLHHGGDFPAATSALRAAGYGAPMQHDDGMDLIPPAGFTAPPPRVSADSAAPGDEAPPAPPTAEDPVLPELETIVAADVVERRVVYLWNQRIPLGALTLMPGEEGIGKTMVGIRLMADLTRGTLAGEFYGTPRSALVVAPEDGIEDVFRPRLREAGADLNRIIFVKSRRNGEQRDSIIIPRDLPPLAREMRKWDAPLLWIDSMVTTLPAELKSISYKDVATVLTRIGTWAADERVAVAGPWHLNKATSSDPALRMMDSRGFRTAVRSLLIVVKDPDAEENGPIQGVVVLDKANAASTVVPALRYQIRSAHYTVDELDELTGQMVEKPASCGVADWTGQLDGDGRAFVRDALAPKIERSGSAKGWLREFLRENGQTPRAEVIVAGKARGFSEEALKRASRGLVHSEEVTGTRMVDGRRAPFRHALWSLASKSGHSSSPHPTDPTDPTGETSSDHIDPICAGRPKSGQSGQSGECRENDPTDDVGGTDWPSPLHAKTREQITEYGAGLFRQARDGEQIKIDTQEDTP